MNISLQSLFKEISVFFIIGLLLIYRYVDIGLEQNQVILFSLYYFFAVLTFVFSRLRFNSPINPISIFVPFLFLLSYSFLQLSENQSVYSFHTLVIINKLINEENRVNYHVIFSDKVSINDIEENFLHELEFIYE